MRPLLRLEELFLALLSVYLFSGLGYAWWWYPALLLTPDLSMIGYLGGPKPGAYVYNLIHHRALAVSLFIGGAMLSNPLLQLAGVIILGHASLDRLFGYGLKHDDAFQHTHLGWIGEAGPGGGAGSMRRP
jgi:hypothetical protein